MITSVLINKSRVVLSASQMHNIEWTNVRQARLNGHSNIQWNLLFLCLQKWTSTKKAPCPRNVIPGPDQGSYLNENTKASESTVQVQRSDSWSQPGMTVLLHLQFHIVLLFLFTKVELMLSESQMHNIEWTNVRQARLNAHSGILWNLLFLCSYVCKKHTPTKGSTVPPTRHPWPRLGILS